MKIHWAFAAVLMSTTAFATVLSVPAWAQEEEDVIILDDDAAAEVESTPAEAPDTATSENTADTANDGADDVPSEPGVTKLKRLIIGSDEPTDADIVNKPAAVSIIDAEDIRERMSGRIDDAIRMTPGAYTRQMDENPGVVVNIRGMQGMGRVNQMIDGVPQTFRNLSGHSGTFDDLLFVDKNLLVGVDITRGAVPGAQGLGTLSGAANFRTIGVDDVILPGKDVGALVTLKAGSNGYDFQRVTAGGWRTNIGIDGEISVIGALAGSDESRYRNGDGQLYPYDNTNHPRSSLFKVNYEPDGEHAFEFGANTYSNAFSIESAGYRWFQDRQTYTAKYAYQPGDNIFDLQMNAYLNIVDIQMDGLTDTSVFDGRDGRQTGLGFDISNRSQYDINDTMALKFFYGGAINSDGYEGNEQRGANPDGTLVKSGVFGDTTFDWGILGITGGLRYDYWNVDGVTEVLDPGEPGCPFGPMQPCTGDSLTRDGGKWNPKIGVTVDATPWMQIYATYAHTMRPPTVQEMFYPGGHNFDGTSDPIQNNPNLKPEYQKGFDIGVNLQGDGLFMSEDMGYLKVGYFRNRIKNYITFATEDDGITRWVNWPGTTTMQGVEVEGGYDTGTAYGRLSFTVADTRQPLAENVGVGSDTGRLPDDFATLDGGLRFFEKRLTLGGRIRYTGDSVQAYIDTANSINRPSYTLVDLYGTFKVTENASVYFNVDNLFNKNYYSAVAGTSSVIDVANGRGRYLIIGGTARF